MTLRLGIIGLGQQIRNEYLAKHLLARIQNPNDVCIPWVSGYLVRNQHDQACVDATRGKLGGHCEFEPDGGWEDLIKRKPVDAVLVSLPNVSHLQPLEFALARGIHAAVDKPTVVKPDDCARLIKLAEANKSVFMTMSQRRYEDVYSQVRELFQNGSLGAPRLIQALMAHEYFGGRTADHWAYYKSLAGGGALIASGYHLIDTVLWLLDKLPQPVRPVSVSALWVPDENPSIPPHDRVETTAAVTIGLNNGGVFQITASYDAAAGALDENIKIYGTRGTIRIMRDRFKRVNMQAAALSFQDLNGTVTEYETSAWVGLRWKPLEEFLAAVATAKQQSTVPPVLSPAADSLLTIAVIDRAYESASRGGVLLPL